METRIRWTDDERSLVVSTLSYYLRTEGKTIADLYITGAFKSYFEIAQSCLPPERRRRLLDGWSQAPWLLEGARAALGASINVNTETIQSVANFVAQNFDAVVAELSKTHLVIERTSLVRSKPSAPSSEATTPRKLRVLVCGLKPVQANELQNAYKGTLDLRFASSDDYRLAMTGVVADYAIGVTGFMAHNVDVELKGTYKSRYIRVVGAFTSVRRTLDELTVIGRYRERN